MAAPIFDWLPTPAPDLQPRLRALAAADAASWAELVGHANTRLDSMGTLQLDRALRRLFGSMPPPGLATAPVRMLLLGSSTLEHLLPGLRVGALRHGIWLEVRCGEYGEMTPGEGAAADVVLLAIDARTALAGLDAGHDDGRRRRRSRRRPSGLRRVGRLPGRAGAAVLQQTVLPVFPPLFGNNEHRLPGSRAASVLALNARLRDLADAAGVDLVDVDEPRGAGRHRRVARPDAVAPRQAGGASRRRAAVRRSGRPAARGPAGAQPQVRWCSISTTRSGAASSATTAWTASSSARAARSARRISRSSTTRAT